MTEDKRKLLISNTAADMMTVTDNIKYRHAAHCYLADCEYGLRLADALGLNVERLVEIINMTEDERLEVTSAEKR
jgi:catalase